MSAPSTDLSSAISMMIPLSVIIAGFVGSPHCASMCGPLVMNIATHRTRLVFYQLGRMTSYVAMGTLAGALGSSVLGDARPLWLTQFSLALIALTLLYNGYRAFREKPLHFTLPKPLQTFSTKLWSLTRRPQLSLGTSGFLMGLLTVLLPCGHLFTFLLGAVATGSAVKGGVFMFAFWLGSSPLLLAAGLALPKLLKRSGAHGRRWAGVLLVMGGLFSLTAFGLRSHDTQQEPGHKTQHETEQPAAPRCH